MRSPSWWSATDGRPPLTTSRPDRSPPKSRRAAAANLAVWREEEALRAFVRCTQMDPENGQAWNNVAALNIRKGSHAAAHVALQEATKQLPNSWQTWENLAMVAAKIGRFQQSARALLKVMELTQGATVSYTHLRAHET